MVRASIRGLKRCEAATWGQQHMSESGVMQSLGYVARALDVSDGLKRWQLVLGDSAMCAIA